MKRRGGRKPQFGTSEIRKSMFTCIAIRVRQSTGWSRMSNLIPGDVAFYFSNFILFKSAPKSNRGTSTKSNAENYKVAPGLSIIAYLWAVIQRISSDNNTGTIIAPVSTASDVMEFWCMVRNHRPHGETTGRYFYNAQGLNTCG